MFVTLRKTRNYCSPQYYRDSMGDMGFSGGFEMMAAGKDTEKWLETVCTGSTTLRVLISGMYS